MSDLEKRVEWLEMQMRLVHRTLDKIDRKTEPQTEEWHDDCNTCRWHDGACTIPCCDYEPQTYITEDRDTQILDAWQVKLKAEQTEPQRDYVDFAGRLAYERGVKHAWEVAQKVFDSTVTFYEAEDVAKQIDKDINVRSKDEPQTDCSWK